MPLAANDNLDELYALHRLLQQEADVLEQRHDGLDPKEHKDRRYVLALQIEALREEGTRLSAAISDILERDLQR
jgi:hypothetical protein